MAVLTPSIRNVIIAIAVVSWPPMARLVRGEFLSMRSREFVLACVSMGMSNARIILRHILPNTLSAIIVTGSLMIATAILIESAVVPGLSDPNTMSWGFIIGAGRTALRSAWWVCTIPGIAILVTVMAINLVGEGLNDALNPRCEPHERFAVKHCRNGALDREPDDRPTSWAERAHAVENVSVALERNEIVCIVGESGSGKSVMARAALGLFPSRHVRPSAGRILFRGENVLAATEQRLRELRGSRIAMIFQEPMTALNPLLTIGRQIEEAIEVHQPQARDRRKRVLDMLASVHLPDPQSIYGAYPHQVSGGQRQRAMIAMALVLDDVLIADEPTTALDVTTQAQILALIREVQRARHMGVLFITHDFGVVAEIAHRIVVMQHGRVVEQGAANDILEAPREDYTRMLLAAVPDLSLLRATRTSRAKRSRCMSQGSRRTIGRAEACWGVRSGLFMQRRRCASRSAAVKRWGSSANLALENPRSRAVSRVLSSLMRVRFGSAMLISHHCRKQRFVPCASASRWCFRIPTALWIRGRP